MASSVGIIGMGWVGSSVAISLLHKGIAKKLMVNDVREDIAEGEAMDLTHGSSFYPSAVVQQASIEEMRTCDVIVITAGRGGKPGESRLELLQDNIKIAKSISNKLNGYEGILVIVSNPVDVLTYFYRQFTGLPAARVIGTGTYLDTARFREIIGNKLNIHAKSVHADVLGEHGDSAVMLWSQASVGGLKLRDWEGWTPAIEDEICHKVRGAAQEIIKRKGATNHAIGLVTAYLVKYLMRDERRIITVSTVLKGIYGLENLALSLPSVLSANGVERIIEPILDGKEHEELRISAEVIQKAIKSVS